MRLNSPTSQRLLALALPILLLALVWFGLVSPLRAHSNANQQQLQALHQQVSRYQQINASLNTLKQQHQQNQQQLTHSKQLLTGRTDALRSAQLQQYLSALISRLDGELEQMQPLEPGSQGNLHTVRIKARLKLSLPQLVACLEQLQAGQPLLTVDDLQINARPAQTLRGHNTQVVWPLAVSLRLTGYSQQEVSL